MASTIKVVKVKRIVDALIEYVRTDYNGKVDKTESFLYRLLGGNVEGDYDFYAQAKEIFLRGDTNPRCIKTSLSWNKNTNGSPHIHIKESARGKGSFNTIGGMIGDTVYVESDGSTTEIYRDTQKGNYEILMTSLNPLDTILMAEVIYSLLYAAYETLVNEFSTFGFNLRELEFRDTSGATLYVKAISIDIQQENFMASIITDEVAANVEFFLESLDEEIIPTPIIPKVNIVLEITGDGTVETNPVVLTNIDLGTIITMKATAGAGYQFEKFVIREVDVTDSLTYVEANRAMTIPVSFIVI